VPQRAHRPAGDRDVPMLKNLSSGALPPITFSSTFIAFGPWSWKR
jgi:hypothetical protein